MADVNGGRVVLSDRVLAFRLEAPAERLDGRERFLPLLRELIEQPAEIWTNWTIDARGRYRLTTVPIMPAKSFAIRKCCRIAPPGGCRRVVAPQRAMLAGTCCAIESLLISRDSLLGSPDGYFVTSTAHRIA